jgi:hypothetical protein
VSEGPDRLQPREKDSGKGARCGAFARVARAALLVALPLIVTAALLYMHHVLLLDMAGAWPTIPGG